MWALLALYAGARVLQAYPGRFPMLLIIGLHVVPPMLFALVHGTLQYGRRAVLVFTAICVVLGNLLENVSLVTGFPFGRYHFTDVMGPKIAQVPILLGLAYIGMGYLSWTVGLLIGGGARKPLAGYRIFTQPLIAAFVMVGWDLSMDPIWSNVVHGWIWHDGGSFFGVPISNFLGWYFTVYLIYQSFALYLRKASVVTSLPAEGWRPAVLCYGVSALGNLFVASPAGSAITDAAGVTWKISDILAVSALVSVFVMGGFTLFAWVRLLEQNEQPARSR